ncbi:hypothetical protein A5700_00905 [Mycobacterium sp. E1214]|nr:hypothetical protein A5700_00905 [Mycobacterium sp. E1214]OBH28152.1 hypothetical protein A5693_22695 [Mycobacterium sp. E1319]
MLYLVVAAIVIVGLAAAAVIAITKPAPSPGSPRAGQAGAGRTTTTSRSAQSTCAGWTTVKSDMQAMTQLPDGWTYDTPQIDIAIHGRAAQLDTIVKLFVDEISPEPADLAATARAWVEAQSVEGPKLVDHTFAPADRANIAAAAHALDTACGSG